MVMVYILDIALVLILSFSIWQGYRNGFIHAVSRLLALVLAALLAPLFSGGIAATVYDSQIGPAVTQAIMQQVQVTGDEAVEAGEAVVSTGVDEIVQHLPSFLQDILAENGYAPGMDLSGQLGINAEMQLQETVTQVVNEMVRPLVIALLETVIMLLLVAVIFALLLVILQIVMKFVKVPMLKKMDSLLGLIPGAVSGVVTVLIVVLLIQLLASVSPVTAPINPQVLEETVLTQWVAEHNPLASALRNMLPPLGILK